jgi:hypothetical protein
VCDDIATMFGPRFERCQGSQGRRAEREVEMTMLPHVLKRIRLNLAHSKDYPSGEIKKG